jgi:hypothetical protein
MSGSKWDWVEEPMTVSNGAWSSVNVPLSSITTISEVNAVVIFINAKGMTGKLAVDYILLNKKGGGADTLESFKTTVFECGPDDGVVVPDELGNIETDKVAAATSIGATGGKTVNYVFKANNYTDNYTYNETITPASNNTIVAPAIAQSIHLSVEHGVINASFNAATAGRTTISLMNSLGQVITSKNVNATRGANSVSLETSYQGAAFLVIRQGSQKMVKTVRLK